MMNLAGRDDCDAQVVGELYLSGAEVVRLPARRSRGVRTIFAGRAGAIELSRAWSYWIALGSVPLEIAEQFDGTSVWARGARNSAASQAEFFDAEGRPLVSDPSGKLAAEWDRFRAKFPELGERPRFVSDEAAVAARGSVPSFHIHDEVGLAAFVAAVTARDDHWGRRLRREFSHSREYAARVEAALAVGVRGEHDVRLLLAALGTSEASGAWGRVLGAEDLGEDVRGEP